MQAFFRLPENSREVLNFTSVFFLFKFSHFIVSDYETALIVARMDSLKDRRKMLMARFFKRQVLASNALLHYLLPERCSFRNSQPFPSIRTHTNKFQKSFLPYCLKNFTESAK